VVYNRGAQCTDLVMIFDTRLPFDTARDIHCKSTGPQKRFGYIAGAETTGNDYRFILA
jgi:hypothetical protein